MNKNQIFIKSGTEYKKMTKELLTASNLAELIGDRYKMVGIKPNLVSPSDPSEGGTTHPEIVAGILEYLKENGFQNMMILEGSWVGDRTADAFEVCGYRSLCENYDVKFYDTQKDKSYVKDCSGLELKICESVKKVDFLINVPVMKGHCQTKITCALKNMKGLIPNTEKRHFHAMGLDCVWVEPISMDAALRDELRGWYHIKRRFAENEVGQRFYFDFYGAKWLAFTNGPGNI